MAAALSCGRESARQSLPKLRFGGGKSGLRRIGCQVTPGGREPTESATESRPPKSLTGPARVKRCGKSAPRRWQHVTARQTPPGARPNREAVRCLKRHYWTASIRARFRVGRLRSAVTRIPEE